MKSVHIIVSGRVQGVYFRAFTEKQAVKHDIVGYVKNKADGTVEIVACSNDPHKLDSFIRWCHKGPLMARVCDVQINDYIASEKFKQFEIR